MKSHDPSAMTRRQLVRWARRYVATTPDADLAPALTSRGTLLDPKGQPAIGIKECPTVAYYTRQAVRQWANIVEAWCLGDYDPATFEGMAVELNHGGADDWLRAYRDSVLALAAARERDGERAAAEADVRHGQGALALAARGEGV